MTTPSLNNFISHESLYLENSKTFILFKISFQLSSKNVLVHLSIGLFQDIQGHNK